TTTAKPVTTTAKPVTTTAKPVTTTANLVTTTAKPVTTTAKPVTTTAKPVTTTSTPITTTATPVTTTAKPVTTTAKPVTTTAKPVTTTAKPVTTTAKPVTTTAKPVTTTAMPVTTTAAPVTTAEPVTTTVSPNTAAIAADSVEAKVGETVRVPVRIQNNPGITALSLDVSYDNTKLTLIGAEDGRLLGTASFLSGRDLTMIPYTLNWDDLASENNTGNGIVAALKFEVLAEGSISVELKLNQRSTFNVDLQEVAFATVNGTVHAVPAEQPGTGFLRGDIDLNGEVSIEDVQFALKVYTERISGKTPQLTDEQLRNGDVNEDGILSVDDAQYILMYYVNNTVAGKNVTWEALIPTLKKA
ncbi:MAG: hypothetical protein IKG82_04880, partial [Oscillospiraceae bacterium]|nr:hypothetical protein [Oscillospiraceae bacterium]